MKAIIITLGIKATEEIVIRSPLPAFSPYSTEVPRNLHHTSHYSLSILASHAVLLSALHITASRCNNVSLATLLRCFQMKCYMIA